jgi:hypothetical protein
VTHRRTAGSVASTWLRTIQLAIVDYRPTVAISLMRSSKMPGGGATITAQPHRMALRHTSYCLFATSGARLRVPAKPARSQPSFHRKPIAKSSRRVTSRSFTSASAIALQEYAKNSWSEVGRYEGISLGYMGAARLWRGSPTIPGQWWVTLLKRLDPTHDCAKEVRSCIVRWPSKSFQAGAICVCCVSPQPDPTLTLALAVRPCCLRRAFGGGGCGERWFRRARSRRRCRRYRIASS